MQVAQLVHDFPSQIALEQDEASETAPCSHLRASVSNLAQALYVVVSAMVVVAQQRAAVHLEPAAHAALQSASRVAAAAEVVPIRAISEVVFMRVNLSIIYKNHQTRHL